jgi:hypothetical protein
LLSVMTLLGPGRLSVLDPFVNACPSLRAGLRFLLTPGRAPILDAGTGLFVMTSLLAGRATILDAGTGLLSVMTLLLPGRAPILDAWTSGFVTD